MPDYRVIAVPSLRAVSPGAKITYRLEPASPNAKPVERLSCSWYCLNDPKGASFFKPNRVSGPSGPSEWRDAEWEHTGRHRIVCRVVEGFGWTDYAYDQEVVELEEALASGPALPLGSQDPEAALDGATRLVELVLAVAKDSPPKEELKDRHEDQLAELEQYRDKLRERLKSTQGARRYPIRAQHFSVESQKWQTLNVFAAEAGGKWWVVDWTNAAVRGLTGEYTGSGGSPEAAIRSAFDEWEEDNRYPNGVLRYDIAGIPKVPNVSGSFETDGSSFWDGVSSFFTWVGIGTAATAAAIMFLSPVPGPQAVSVLIWSSIFSSTAAATINIGQRADEGFSSWQANAFDVLAIVGNMFGVAGILWSRGAQLTTQVGSRVLKAVLVGQVTTDSVQGVLIGAEHYAEIDRIRTDASLTPREKTNRILELCRSLAINGLLIYVNVKGTKADLDNLNLKPQHFPGEAPGDKLKRLGNPDEKLDLTKSKFEVEGHTDSGDHTTTLHLDEESAPVHAGGRGTAVRTKTRAELLRDAMTHEQYTSYGPWADKMLEQPRYAHLTKDELIALRGYTGNENWIGEIPDYKRINQALRNNDAQQLSILEAYIDEINNALSKMPKYTGYVERAMQMSPEEVARQFKEGESWRSLSFMSTNVPPATFPGNVKIVTTSKTGVLIKELSIFDAVEDEVLFAAGSEFWVVSVERHENSFVITMVER